MRTQSMMLLACLVLVLAVAAPSLANNPLPNERAFYVEDVNPRIHVPANKIACLPIYQLYHPCIPIPLTPEPGIDDGPFQRLVKPVTSTNVNHAR